MSLQTQDVRTEPSEPGRPLRSDFTKHALQNAARAKRRACKRQQFHTLFKELYFMKKPYNVLRTVPGIAAVATVVIAGSVGVYALSNWFGGNVAVTQKDPSVFSVDLSSCKGNLPPGVNPTDDPHDVQFKVMGNPHISTQVLQQDLLADCENSAVENFYAQKFPDAHFTTPTTATSASAQYMLLSATVQAVNADGTITLNPVPNTKTMLVKAQTFTMARDATIYNEGSATTMSVLKAGDPVTAVAYSAGATSVTQEGTSILGNSNVQLESIFKTQYSGGGQSLDYSKANVIPLDTYNQLPNGKQYK